MGTARPCGSRIGYETVSKKTGEPVALEDIEMGYEVGKGRYVTFDEDELDELSSYTDELRDLIERGDRG